MPGLEGKRVGMPGPHPPCAAPEAPMHPCLFLLMPHPQTHHPGLEETSLLFPNPLQRRLPQEKPSPISQATLPESLGGRHHRFIKSDSLLHAHISPKLSPAFP